MKNQALLQGTLGERRYDLDWVRIGAFLLLICYHVGMYYVSWDWHVKSPSASHTIEPLMMLSSPWRLSLLFLISGVATGFLLERHKGGGFLGQRSVRLLVPLLFGMAVIVPPQSYLQVVEKLAYPGSYVDFWRLYITGYHGFCSSPNDCLLLPTWNHLWFVAYLWIYTLLLYVGVRMLPRVIPVLRDGVERALSGAGVLVWPIAYLASAGLLLASRFPQTHMLVNDWYNHAIYGAIFLLGFALAGTQAPWAALERSRWGALGGAVLGWALLCGLTGVYDHVDEPPMVAVAIYRIVYGVQQWLAIAAVLGFARKHLCHDSAARRYLTTAIFPVYILHQTVIVIYAHNLKGAHLYPLVEGVLLILATAATCFMAYEVIRRVAVLRPLFGLASEKSITRRPLAPLAVPQDIN